MKNVRSLDRFLRFAAAILLLEAGLFWLASPWSWLAYGLAAVMAITALTRFCPLYRLVGVSSLPSASRHSGMLARGAALLALAALLVGGSYASDFFTRKFFLEDFNAMNNYYKQTLFLTGKEQREGAIGNYDKLVPALAAFTAKYSQYRPYALRGDGQLDEDFKSVDQILKKVEPLVRTGDLHQAHLDLEAVRPVFQEMFKRNGFSMLAVALVDFHDAMETVLAPATAKDAAKITELYAGVSDKLKIVEAEANDPEIQAIRKALEDLHAAAQAAQTESLPALGDALKSSFVKVYLKRG